MIPFNIPYSTGKEASCMEEAQARGQIAGNGHFTSLCMGLVRRLYGYQDTFFTPSCTSALEMAALLCEFRTGDEVILPSFTHVGTASAFVRAGASLKFGDCRKGQPHLDPESVCSLIGPKTRALIVVHYAGIACDMDAFCKIARANRLILIEDAAHAIGARYRDEWIGLQADLATFSFHETKNITSGQGGLLLVNRPDMADRAKEIWHLGTNRADFEEGKTSSYTWVRAGGPFLMPDLNAAFLYPQLCEISQINARRAEIWQQFYRALAPLQASGLFCLPIIPSYAQHNAHIFYLVAASSELRNDLIAHLNRRSIQALFHYIPLHTSPYISERGGSPYLPNTEYIAGHLLRLPLYNSLTGEKIREICDSILEWANKLCIKI